MFLVTMVLAVLASVGLYALAASTNEVIASGSERQATETHYLGELGVVGGAQYMSASTAQIYINKLLGSGHPDTNCWSLPNQSLTQPDPFMRFCTHVADTEMSAGWSASSFGSFGSIAASTPDFTVEYTGLSPGPPPHGYQIASGAGSNGTPICFVTTTASSYGQTVPAPASGTFGEGLETQRARFNVGPVTGAECQ
jgi:type II secretory pathway pseudopilin PulG